MSTPVHTCMPNHGGGRPDAENQVNLLCLATHSSATAYKGMRCFHVGKNSNILINGF
jgi:hypothetical protein